MLSNQYLTHPQMLLWWDNREIWLTVFRQAVAGDASPPFSSWPSSSTQDWQCIGRTPANVNQSIELENSATAPPEAKPWCYHSIDLWPHHTSDVFLSPSSMYAVSLYVKPFCINWTCQYEIDLWIPKSIGVFLALSSICVWSIKSISSKLFELSHYIKVKQNDSMTLT